jgi:hypothetical protein
LIGKVKLWDFAGANASKLQDALRLRQNHPPATFRCFAAVGGEKTFFGGGFAPPWRGKTTAFF